MQLKFGMLALVGTGLLVFLGGSLGLESLGLGSLCHAVSRYLIAEVSQGAVSVASSLMFCSFNLPFSVPFIGRAFSAAFFESSAFIIVALLGATYVGRSLRQGIDFGSGDTRDVKRCLVHQRVQAKAL